MSDKERIIQLLSEYGVADRYIDDLCDEIEECFVPELEKAEKWDALTKKYPHFCTRFDPEIDGEVKDETK